MTRGDSIQGGFCPTLKCWPYPVIVFLYVLFLKLALNCIMKNEKYRNCCILFELIKQRFGINKRNYSVSICEIDLKLNMSTGICVWALFQNFGTLISKPSQHQRSNAVVHIVKTM